MLWFNVEIYAIIYGQGLMIMSKVSV